MFRDPFSVDSVVGNAAANTFNDMMMGNKFAEWAWIWADHCRPMMERIFAGWKIIAMGAVMAGGGLIVRGAMRAIGAGVSKLLSGGGGAALDAGGGAVEKLALGIEPYLDDFARSQGAGTWKTFPDPVNWKPTMLEKLADSKVKILFNLDGPVEVSRE